MLSRVMLVTVMCVCPHLVAPAPSMLHLLPDADLSSGLSSIGLNEERMKLLVMPIVNDRNLPRVRLATKGDVDESELEEPEEPEELEGVAVESGAAGTGGKLSLGGIIMAVPWLPLEVNVPDTVAWFYNGIASIVSGLGQRFPLRPRPSSGPPQLRLSRPPASVVFVPVQMRPVFVSTR